MQTVRRTANLAPIRARLAAAEGLPAPVQDIADALMSPARPATQGEIVAMRTTDRLDDSLEDLWPGLAAETAARRGAPPVAVGPYRHPQHVLDAIAEAEAAAKTSRRRKPKDADDADPAEPKPRRTRKAAAKDPAEAKPRRARKAKAEPAAPVEAPAPVEVPAPVEAPAPMEPAPAARQPAARAALGQRRVEPAVLPTAAKRVVEGSDIPGKVVGTVTVTGSFRASTGEAIVIDIEGQNNVARGVVVWAGPLQAQVRAAQGRLARLAIRQPSNPRYKPSVSAIDVA